MTRHIPLNNVDHKHLRIDATRGDALGDGVMIERMNRIHAAGR